MELPDDARARAMAMIDRAYATFVRFADVLHAVIASSRDETRIRDRLEELALTRNSMTG